MIFISRLGLLKRFSMLSIYVDTFDCLILQYYSLSSWLYSTLPFSLFICSAMPDFSVSPQTTSFHSSTLIFREYLVSTLYFLSRHVYWIAWFGRDISEELNCFWMLSSYLVDHWFSKHFQICPFWTTDPLIFFF